MRGYYAAWSNHGAAYEKNVGWRLDYQIGTLGIAAKAESTSIYVEEKFSDHALLEMDYKRAL
jgi:exodeoxyribonuclease III